MPVEAPKGFGRIWEHLKLGIRKKGPDQRKEMEARSTELLKDLIEIASPFMVLDELSLAEKVSRTRYLTPPVPISDGDSVSGEAAAKLKDFCYILVDRKRHVDFSGIDGDMIGEEQVTAGLFIKVPEGRVPLPVVLFEGAEVKMGEVDCAVARTFGYGRGQRRSELERIKIVQGTVADIKLYFDANPDIAKAQEEVVIQVPQK